MATVGRLRRAAATLILGLATTGGIACDGPAGPPGAPGQSIPGDDGEKGEPGPPIEGEASINAVLPGAVFLGRVIEVSIGGYGTSWNDDTQVDFGPDIEVLSTFAASPTSLNVTLEVSNEADVGPRDVIVRHDDTELTYGADAFEVTSPISFVLQTHAPVEQGSGGYAQVYQRDLSTPFEGGYTAYLARDGEQLGIDVELFDVTTLTTGVIFYIDVDAPAGPVDLVLDHPFFGTSVAKDAIDIVARTPTPLSEPGTTLDVMGSETYLFELSVAGPTEISITLSPDEPQTLSVVSILPTTKWEDAFFSGAFFGVPFPYAFQGGIGFLATEAASYHVLVANLELEQLPHSLQVDVTTNPITVLTPTVPGVQMGDITGATDGDWYAIDALGGQTLLSATFDAATTSQCAVDLDSELVLVDETGTQVLNGNDDNPINLCSEMFSFIPEDGRYYLRVGSAQKCGGCAFDYQLYLELL